MNKIVRILKIIAVGVFLLLLLLGVILMRLILVPFVWIEINNYYNTLHRFKFEREVWIMRESIRKARRTPKIEGCQSLDGCFCSLNGGVPESGCMFLNIPDGEK